MPKYRLSDHEVKSIIATIEQLDRHAEIYLFGSRVDPNLKGGDIDLLLVSSRLSFNDKITILTLLEEKIGEQKLDILIRTKEQIKSDPFVKTIRKIRLN